MIKRILATTDGSAFAERALPYAIALSNAAKAELTLLRAFESEPDRQGGITEPQAKARKEVGAEMDELTEKVRAAGVEVKSRIYYGTPEDAIRELAGSLPADVVVMATHGRSGPGRWIYGSVAEGVILASSDLPILLIPSHFAPPVWASNHGFKVLVPLDGSELAAAALDAAIEFAETFSGEIILMKAVSVPAAAYAGSGPYYVGAHSYELAVDGIKRQTSEARGYLEGIAQGLMSRVKKVSVCTSAGNPAVAITQMAENQQAGVIVMATHGRSGLARLVMGSVAAGVVRRSSIPTVIVRPRG